MRASALFSRRGQWRGLDLDDWLEAEREISLAEDEVVLSESDERIDISISAARAEPGHIILSLLRRVSWRYGRDRKMVRRARMLHIPSPGLSLLLLPRSVDPERAAVEYNDGRVWLQLPYAENDSNRRSSNEKTPNIRCNKSMAQHPGISANGHVRIQF
jgi:hypothetical protein